MTRNPTTKVKVKGRCRHDPSSAGSPRLAVTVLRLVPDKLARLLSSLVQLRKVSLLHWQGRPLDRLPVETLQEIFLLACTDGGKTACSLALVSKCIRAVSSVARFHSVSLFSCSHSRLVSFVDRYACVRAAAARANDPIPRIRHLCIDITSFCEKACRDSADRRRKFLSNYRCTCYPNPRQHRFVANTLLDLVAEDLETLCLYDRREWHSQRFGKEIVELLHCSGFPKLQTFSYWNCDPSNSPIFSCQNDDRGRNEPPFPALSRLQIGGLPTTIDLSRWIKDAPRLEELRFSHRCSDMFGTESCPDWFTDPLKTALCLDRPSWLPPFQVKLRGRGEIQRIARRMTPYYAATERLLAELFYQAPSPPPYLVCCPTRLHNASLTLQREPIYYGTEAALMELDWLAQASGCEGAFPDEFWVDS